MDLVLEPCLGTAQGPDFGSAFIDPPHQTGSYSSSRTHVAAQTVNCPQNHTRIDRLNHVGRGKPHGYAQRKMNENMGCDTGWKQKIVGVEENGIFARTCLEALFRGEALTAIVVSPQDCRGRILI